MANIVGDGVSIGTGGWVTTGRGDDATAPGAFTIAFASRTTTTITVTHVPPVDADYSTTEFYAFALEGGDDATLSSSATPVTLTGLTAGQRYDIVAVAKDTSGNRTVVVNAGNTIRTAGTSTASGDAGASYGDLEIDWYVDRKASAHSMAPWRLDATSALASGKLETKARTINTGQIRELRLRIRCKAPVRHIEIVEIALAVEVPRAPGRGRGLG